MVIVLKKEALNQLNVQSRYNYEDAIARATNVDFGSSNLLKILVLIYSEVAIK